MTRKCTTRKRVMPKAPMLVVLHNVPDIGLSERISAEAFANGYVTTEHYDNLADCRDILTLAAGQKDDQSALAVCAIAKVALLNIKHRHVQTGKFGATGDELQTLRLLCDTSEDFWSRQSGGAFEDAYNALKQWRSWQKGGSGCSAPGT